MMALNLLGKRFGRLLVLRRLEEREMENIVWLCRCDCGGLHLARSSRLQAGIVKSCGCFARQLSSERLRRRATTHGMSRSSLYGLWQGMIGRCERPNTAGYMRYGGRGITVCARWRKSFSAFLEDMGPRPDGTSLDRINNDGNYEPSNCRWATRSAQQNNRDANRRLEHNGATKSLTEWAREIGISPEAITARLRRGWEIEHVFSVPVSLKKPHYKTLISLEQHKQK